MSITDPQTTTPTPLTWHQRCDLAKAAWERAQDAANTALGVLVATIGEALDDEVVHEQLFAGAIEVGDQIIWGDGWWFVTGVLHGPEAAAVGADTVVCASRVGHEPIELKLPGNILFTVVRCSP